MTTTTVTTFTKNHTVEVDCFLNFEAVVEELKQQQHLTCKQKRTTLPTVPIAKTYEQNMVDSDCFLYFNAVVAELVSNQMEQVSDEWTQSLDRSWNRSTSNSSDDGDY